MRVYEDNRSRAADRLLAAKDRILVQWEAQLRAEVAAAQRQPHLVLVNTLPAVLDQLAEALSPDHPRRTATQGNTTSSEHGGERVRLTRFHLQDLIAEYKILRHVLFAVLEEDEPLSRDDRETLNASLDQAIVEACTAYAIVQATFRDQFLATLAHDLRNPLNAALAAAALIASQPQSSDVGRWAARVTENVNRADRRLQDLLNTMRLQTGAQLTLDLAACDLVDVVRQTLDRLRSQHGDRFILTAPNRVHGYIAADALQRAIENLADNAVKYGDPRRPITMAVHEAHGRAILAVHNDGPHIPAEQQESLFRAFLRLSDAEQSGKTGWGLGLAQVRAVAEAHGGSIGVDSLPGQGTTFIIDIPLDARPYQNTPITPTRLDDAPV